MTREVCQDSSEDAFSGFLGVVRPTRPRIRPQVPWGVVAVGMLKRKDRF